METSDTDRQLRVRRIIRQRLESLQRAGVQQIGRPESSSASVTDEIPGPPTVDRSDSPAEKPPEHLTLIAESPESAEATMPAMSDSSMPTPLSLDQRNSELAKLCGSVTACTQCPELVANRSQTVFGVGNPQARLCFFGEAPGADEDRQGEPFVGRAGQLLTKIIEACTLTRDDVYIMNVLKCRPPQNRNPSPEEAMNCRPFFERQLEIIRPEYICCLGSIAATTLLETKQSIGKMRGQLHEWRWAKVLVTYHPAYLLRNPSAKREVWNDMQFLMGEMDIEIPTQ